MRLSMIRHAGHMCRARIPLKWIIRLWGVDFADFLTDLNEEEAEDGP